MGEPTIGYLTEELRRRNLEMRFTDRAISRGADLHDQAGRIKKEIQSLESQLEEMNAIAKKVKGSRKRSLPKRADSRQGKKTKT